MDVACQHCPSVYPISEQKLAGRLVRFRCKSCGNAIVVDGRQNPSRPPVAITSVPPLSLANIATSVAPQPQLSRSAPPIPSFGAINQPNVPQIPNAAPAPLSSGEPGQVPRLATLARPTAAKPSSPPPFPTDSAVNQGRLPTTRAQASSPAVGSSPSAPARIAPSEPPPPPFRAASQPHNPNPQEVDPSVYEDETVAMTAMELEAAADAQSHIPPSEPPVPHWSSSMVSNNPVATVLAAPAPSASLTPPPPPPWSAANQPGGVASVSNVITASGVQTSFADSHGPSSAPSFEFDPMGASAPKPVRAESWSIGKNPPPPPNPFAPAEWRPQPTPAPISGRTLTSAEPPPQDNPWLFRGLLVVLGIGGVVLGGVLGNTWLKHLLPAQTPQSAATPQQTEIMNPNLSGFDAMGANERLEAAQAEAVNCLNADTVPLTGLLVARFRPTGELDALTMTGSVGTAPETPCIRSVFDKVKVAPFRGVTSQVEKALELRPRP